MSTTSIYLTFKDNCEEAFTFYKSILEPYNLFSRLAEGGIVTMPFGIHFFGACEDKFGIQWNFICVKK